MSRTKIVATSSVEEVLKQLYKSGSAIITGYLSTKLLQSAKNGAAEGYLQFKAGEIIDLYGFDVSGCSYFITWEQTTIRYPLKIETDSRVSAQQKQPWFVFEEDNGCGRIASMRSHGDFSRERRFNADQKRSFLGKFGLKTEFGGWRVRLPPLLAGALPIF